MESCYKTKDLYEGSFLYAKGQKLLNLEKEKRFFRFVFNSKKQCERLSNDYWQGVADVNAKKYASAIRVLKDRVFAQK